MKIQTMPNILIFLLLSALGVLLSASDWHPVRIVMSDGTAMDGEIALMGARPLTINSSPEKRSVARKIHFEDLLSLSQTVESAAMERPWMYKESGKNERIYFDGKYPLVNFKTNLLLVNGEQLSGHIITLPLRFRDPRKKIRKLFLSRQIKGKEGETLESLLYPEKIVFLENKPKEGASITGSVSGLGILQQVHALDRKRNVMTEARIKGNTFTFPLLLPGTYDLTVLTDRHILTGFQGDDPVPPELEKNFRLADDFFPDRRILRRSGTRTLVYKRRTDFHHAARHVKGGVLWHLEVWNWHYLPAGNEWKLDTRNMLLRIKQSAGERNRAISLADELSNVEPGKTLILNGTSALGTPLPGEDAK